MILTIPHAKSPFQGLAFNYWNQEQVQQKPLLRKQTQTKAIYMRVLVPATSLSFLFFGFKNHKNSFQVSIIQSQKFKTIQVAMGETKKKNETTLEKSNFFTTKIS